MKTPAHDQISFEGLPGAEMIRQGLADAATNSRTAPACLVWIAFPRLHRAGLIPDDPRWEKIENPELTLYRMLREEGARDPFSRYNALLRELVSFEHALDHRARLSGTLR